MDKIYNSVFITCRNRNKWQVNLLENPRSLNKYSIAFIQRVMWKGNPQVDEHELVKGSRYKGTEVFGQLYKCVTR